MEFAPAFFPLNGKGDKLFTSPDVDYADEKLDHHKVLGDHFECDGYITRETIKNPTGGTDSLDSCLVCTKCSLKVPLPNSVQTYGDLERFLR